MSTANSTESLKSYLNDFDNDGNRNSLYEDVDYIEGNVSVESIESKGTLSDLEKESGWERNLDEIVQELYSCITSDDVHKRGKRINLLLVSLTQTGGDGYYLKHLPAVIEILEFLVWESAEKMEYQGHLNRMLDVCMKPLILERSSEHLFCFDILQQYFSFLGYLLMTLPLESQISKIHRTIHNLLIQPNVNNVTATVKSENCCSAMEKSRLPLTLLELLEHSSSETYIKMLELAFLILSLSVECCFKLIKEGLVNILLARTHPMFGTKLACRPPTENIEDLNLDKDDYYEKLTLTVNILMVLVNVCLPIRKLPPEIQNISPTRHAMWSVRSAFRREVLRSKLSHRSKLLRNDLALLFLAGLVVFPSWKLVRSGLADDLAVLAIATEFGTEGTWAASATFGYSIEDFHFKKTVLLIVTFLTQSDAAVTIMEERLVLPALLQLINPDLKCPKKQSSWSSSEFWHLCLCAMSALIHLVQKLPHEFVKYKGPHRLLTMLNWSMTIEFDPCIAMNIAKTICSIIIQQNPVILDDFGKRGIVDSLIKLANRVLESEVLTMQLQRILTIVLVIIETVMQGKSKLKEAYGDQSIEMIRAILSRCYCRKKQDFKQDQKLLIAVGSYIWENIVWCSNNIQKFVNSSLIYTILDIVEHAVLPVRCLYFGLLVDMCEGAFCGSYLFTWRSSDKEKGFLSLLARSWREEESKIGVGRNASGCINDVELPLMGTEQWLQTYRGRLAYDSSPALSSMIGSVRPKIYSIRKVMERDNEKCEIIKEKYKVLLNDLPTEDLVTMCIVDHYYRLKQGQLWIEVSRFLEQVGVTPLGMDGQFMFLMIQRHRGWGMFIQNRQYKLIKDAQEKEWKLEREMLSKIRDARLGHALNALNEMDYVRKTTDRNYLNEKKKRLYDQIQASQNYLPNDGECHQFHRTFDTEITDTIVLGQNVTVPISNVHETHARQEEIPAPVSAESSSALLSESSS